MKKVLIYTVICSILAILFPSCQVRYVPGNGPVRIGMAPPAGYGSGYAQQGQYRRPMQPGQGQQAGGERSLKPYYAGQQPTGKMITGYKKVQTGTTKTLKSHFQADVWTGYEGRKHEVATYAMEHYDRTGELLSEQQLTEHFGFRCRAKKVN